MLKLNDKVYTDNNVYELKNINEVSFLSVNALDGFNFATKEISVLNEDYLNSNKKFNLLDGFTKEYIPERLEKDKDYILHWILNKDNRKILLPMKFLSYRGTLTKISSFPYENREGFALSIIKFKGLIYIWWFNTSDHSKEEPIEFRKAVYSGYRFENIMTNSCNFNETEVAVNNERNGEFLSVVSSKLESRNSCHNLIYAGEVDCLKESNKKYVELKSRFRRSNYIDYTLKRFYFLKWYLQSYLIGIENVIVGYRNGDFEIEEIKEYDVNFFCRMAWNSRPDKDLWKSSVCWNFLGSFLSEVENFMTDFNESEICLAEFNVQNKEVTFKKTNQDSFYDFLPQWFRDQMNSEES